MGLRCRGVLWPLHLEEISMNFFRYLREYFSFLVSLEGHLILYWVNRLILGDKCCWRGFERVDNTWVRLFRRWDWLLVSFPPLPVFALSDYGDPALWDKTKKKIAVSVRFWKSYSWPRLRTKRLVFVAFSRPCRRNVRKKKCGKKCERCAGMFASQYFRKSAV